MGMVWVNLYWNHEKIYFLLLVLLSIFLISKDKYTVMDMNASKFTIKIPSLQMT